MYRREYIASAAVGCPSVFAGCSASGPDFRLQAFQLPVTFTSGDTVKPGVNLVSDDRSRIETEVIVEIGDLRAEERAQVDSGETRTVAIEVEVDLEPGRYEATADAAGANNELSQQVQVVDAVTAETGQRTTDSLGHVA